MADEYIKREAVLNEQTEICYWDGLHDSYGDFVPVEKVRSIPAADVVEVVHGEWIADRSPVEVEFRCSECGYSYIEADSYQNCDYNYCPNCGAKMDGEKNG